MPLPKRPSRFFGSLNDFRSSEIRTRFIDPRQGRGNNAVRKTLSTIANRYTRNSLKRQGNIFEAQVLAVQPGIPAANLYPELYINSNTTMPEEVGEESTRIIPEYFLFFLKMEIDSFIPDSDSVSDPTTRAKIISSKGRAISQVPAAEFGPVGAGDIVRIYLPYQNSYNGAKVLSVSIRNSLEPIAVEPDPSQLFWMAPAAPFAEAPNAVIARGSAGGSTAYIGAPRITSDTTALCTDGNNIRFFTDAIEKINVASQTTSRASYNNTYDDFIRFFNTVVRIAAESEPNFTPEQITRFNHQGTARGLYRPGQHLSSGEQISGTVVDHGGRLHALPDREFWGRLIPLVVIMQLLRDEVASPITLRNWWRPVAYNRSVGGSGNSAHIYGTGVDIDFTDANASKRAQQLMYSLYNCTENFDALGLGYGLNTIHFDINTPSQTKRRGWLYGSFARVSADRAGAFGPSWRQHT